MESILMCMPPLCGNGKQSMGGRTRQQQANQCVLAASTRSEREILTISLAQVFYIPLIQHQKHIYYVQGTGLDTELNT